MNYPEYIAFEKLMEEHPEVELNSQMYETIDLLLEGGAKLMNHVENFLVKKPDEDKDIYCFRKKIFSYEPILGQCLAQLLNRLCVSSYIVEGLPQEGMEAKFWSKLRENLNGNKMKEKEFIKEVFMTLLKYRKAFIVVDKPYTDFEIESLKDEMDNNLNPYALVYGGNTVAHYQEVDGQLQWIKLRKLRYEYSPVAETRCFIQWTFIDSERMAQYETEVELDEFGKYKPCSCGDELLETEAIFVRKTADIEHGRGEIPVIKIELPQNLYVAKEAFFLCLEHIRIHNNLTYSSVVAGQIQRLFKPIKEGADQTVDMGAAQLQTGNDRVLIGESFSFNETTGSAINTVSTYMSRLEARIKDIIFSNGLSNSTDRPIQESGVAKSMDFIAQEQALQSYGEKLIDALEYTYRMIARIRPQSEQYEEEISVSGMNEFVLDSIDSKIARMVQLDQLETPISNTTQKLVALDLQRALTPYASTLEQNAIKTETEVLFADGEDYPDLETNEIISLVQNQLLSNATAQEMLGFNPEEEKNMVEGQMLDMAETESEIAEIMGVGAEQEGVEGEPTQEAQKVIALAEILAQETGATVQEILDSIEFNDQLNPEDINTLVEILAEQIGEFTGAPAQEILAGLNNGTAQA